MAYSLPPVTLTTRGNSKSVNSTPSSRWFGDRFAELHPLIQNLHIHGGTLSGPVTITLGRNLAGIIGRRLAGKLGIPMDAREHALQVTISHQADGLHWDRCFDSHHWVRSLFQPVGQSPDGCWIEHTGPIKLSLSVDIRAGGWYWRVLKGRIGGINMPRWLLPQTTAYKRIEDDRYRFYVGIAVPMLGTVLSYSGLLEARPD